jgi:hypothetical protein
MGAPVGVGNPHDRLQHACDQCENQQVKTMTFVGPLPRRPVAVATLAHQGGFRQNV